MPTEASQRALQGLRDLSTLEWYVIPLLAIVFVANIINDPLSCLSPVALRLKAAGS
jgi:hypothetical protein